MKPLGTISKYYPFIDEESKSILRSLMDETSSYNDFVQQLCEVVTTSDVPVNLAYVAASQAWWCRTTESMQSIQEKFKDVPCIRPWGHLHNSLERDQIEFHNAVTEAIEKATGSNVEDWIETDLHLLHAFYHWPLGDISSYLEPLEKAKGLMKANASLGCFEPLSCAFEGLALARDVDVGKSIEVLQRGEQLVEHFDDALYRYMLLLNHANVMNFMLMDIQGAMSLFEELYELVQELDVTYYRCEVLNDSSLAFEAAGEYDLAISSIQEIISLEPEGGLVESNFIILSKAYAALGNGPKAFEWIDRGFEYFGQFRSPLMLLQKAWALALVDRLDEAEQVLEDAYSLIMKVGLERHLGDYYHISGVVEYRKGNYLTAIELLEKAWEIEERVPRAANQNRALLDLARVEIQISNHSADHTGIVVPGKWLSKLEKLAFDRNLPGIRMQAALLKSEFYQKHDQLKDARSTLVEALSITDSLSVKTLRKEINERIQELDHLLIDQ